jgi:nucleotide-binding universal stress UspA family protein
MKKILIATDGSPASIEALEVGFELAAAEEARAIVVHVAPAIDSAPTGGFGLSPAALTHQLTAADRAPLGAALELEADLDYDVDVDVELLRGTPVNQIVAYAEEHDVDLIVVGSRGHGAFTTALLGSVSLGVLRHTRRPVLVVHGSAEKPAHRPVEAAVA